MSGKPSNFSPGGNEENLGFTPLPVVNKRAPVPLATVQSPPGSSSSPTRRFPRLWKLRLGEETSEQRSNNSLVV